MNLKMPEECHFCPILWNTLDCNPPGSAVHGIFQATVLEWIAISFSRGSSQPRDWTWVSHIVNRCFTIWATREDLVPLVLCFSSVLFLSNLMHVTKPCSSHSISSGVFSSEKLSCKSFRCFWIRPHYSMATFTAQHDTCHLVLKVAAQ